MLSALISSLCLEDGVTMKLNCRLSTLVIACLCFYKSLLIKRLDIVEKDYRMDKTVVKFTYCTVLPVSFSSPNINIFLLQEITSCVLGGIKENEVGRSTKKKQPKTI